MSWKEKYSPRLVKDVTGSLVEVDFDDFHCQLLLDRYADGGLCLRLVDMDHFDRIAIATSSVQDAHPPHGYVFIKDYAENAGVLETLCHAGVITDTGERVSTGHAELAVARLAPQVQQQFDAWVQSSEKSK